MRLKKKSRLILAMDLEDEKKSLEVCNNVKDYIDAIKVGYPLILSNGLGILTKIKNLMDHGILHRVKKIILKLKM